MTGSLDTFRIAILAVIVLVAIVAVAVWWRRRRTATQRAPLPVLPESGADADYLDSSHIFQRPTDPARDTGKPGAPGK